MIAAKDMQIKDIMQSPAVLVQPETPVADAVALMVDHGATELPVVSDDGELIGIVGEADLYRTALSDERGTVDEAVALPRYSQRVVGDVMRRPVISIRLSESLALCELRLVGLARSLPVLDNGKVVGVISRRDLLTVFAARGSTPPSDVDSPHRGSRPVHTAIDSAAATPPVHISVGMVMSTPVISVTEERSLFDTWALMNGSGIHHVAVTLGDRCIGIVDDRRLAAFWPQGPTVMSATPVSHLLGRRTPSLLPDASLSDAAVTVKGDTGDAVPVVDGHGALVGLLTSSDLVEAVARWGIDSSPPSGQLTKETPQ